jgi:hypothetical protein
MQRIMAWRPYSNLIDGELDNRVPGKVTGWMRFFRTGRQPLKAVFDLAGDFHEDIRGKVIRFRNPEPSDKYGDAERTYMEGFSRVQRGTTGDITAGLSLGHWTSAIAGKLMAQNELLWEEAGLSQADRERRRQEYAGSYRKHIDAGDLFHRGATELIAKVRKLHKEAEDAEGALERLGFDCGDERIRLRWDAPKSLSRALEAAQRSARTERQRSLRKFDLATLGVWSAETADDARKIVEGLL